MKQIIVLSFILYICIPAYSQDCCDRLIKQGVENDSLRKVVKAEKEMNQQYILNYQKISKDLNDSLKILRSELSKLEIFKADKWNIDNQLKQKNDSIILMKNQISEKTQQISVEIQQCEQKLREGKEKGKNEALANVINGYKNKSFDNMILSSTKLSVQRDIQLVATNSEIKPILSDLERYFNAEELLAKKIDAVQIKNAQFQLTQIKQQSVLLDKLKENIDYYEDFNNALKKTIEKLVELDRGKIAEGDALIQKMKFNEIVFELSNYVYDYYEYSNYPYLSDIVTEIIKRKKRNADADITDLLINLQ